MVVVNLINASGEEGALASVFSRDVTLLHNPSVRYFHFDFHDYCRNNRYDQVSVMYSMLRDEHKQMGFVSFVSFLSLFVTCSCVFPRHPSRYFFQIGGELPAAMQTGVFRTNCIDCLDRTNVVQNTLSTEALLLQLKGLGAVNALSTDLSSLPALSRWWQDGLLFPHSCSFPLKDQSFHLVYSVGKQRRLHQHAIHRKCGIEDRLHAHGQAQHDGQRA